MNKTLVFPHLRDMNVHLLLNENNMHMIQASNKIILQTVFASGENTHRQIDCLATLDPATIVEEIWNGNVCDSLDCCKCVLLVLNGWRTANGLQPYPCSSQPTRSAFERSHERFCVAMRKTSHLQR